MFWIGVRGSFSIGEGSNKDLTVLCALPAEAFHRLARRRRSMPTLPLLWIADFNVETWKWLAGGRERLLKSLMLYLCVSCRLALTLSVHCCLLADTDGTSWLVMMKDERYDERSDEWDTDGRSGSRDVMARPRLMEQVTERTSVAVALAQFKNI